MRLCYPADAHSGPTWQVLLREMQVLPQALPTEQTLQQESAMGVECEVSREVTDRKSGPLRCGAAVMCGRIAFAPPSPPCEFKQ
jgi:hypothetical protein